MAVENARKWSKCSIVLCYNVLYIVHQMLSLFNKPKEGLWIKRVSIHQANSTYLLVLMWHIPQADATLANLGVQCLQYMHTQFPFEYVTSYDSVLYGRIRYRVLEYHSAICRFVSFKLACCLTVISFSMETHGTFLFRTFF